MGSKISSTTFYTKVTETSNKISCGPPRFVELNANQKKLAKKLILDLDHAEKVCMNIDICSGIIKPKKWIVHMALPCDDILIFDKKALLNKSAHHMFLAKWDLEKCGFLSNVNIAYLGRMLRALQTTIEDDIKNNDDLKNEIKTNHLNIVDIVACEKSINDSFKTLNEFCSELPMAHRESHNTIWVLEKTKTIKAWNNVIDSQNKE